MGLVVRGKVGVRIRETNWTQTQTKTTFAVEFPTVHFLPRTEHNLLICFHTGEGCVEAPDVINAPSRLNLFFIPSPSLCS